MSAMLGPLLKVAGAPVAPRPCHRAPPPARQRGRLYALWGDGYPGGGNDPGAPTVTASTLQTALADPLQAVEQRLRAGGAPAGRGGEGGGGGEEGEGGGGGPAAGAGSAGPGREPAAGAVAQGGVDPRRALAPGRPPPAQQGRAHPAAGARHPLGGQRAPPGGA